MAADGQELVSTSTRPTTGLGAVVLLVVLAVLSACGAGPGAGGESTPPRPEPDRSIRYMPLGDSITDGYPGTQGGYRTLLWQLLVQRDGDKIDFVGSQSGGPPELGDPDHEGHRGFCIAGPCGGHPERTVAPRVQGWMEQYRPDIVSVHLGTNDLIRAAHGVTVERRLDDLLGKIYAADPDVHVIVVQIVQGRKNDVERAAYDAAIPTLASRYRAQGRSIAVVDMGSLLSMPTNFVDGTHPTQFGYDLMARALHPAVSQAYREVAAAHS